jgi:hypothetical protein
MKVFRGDTMSMSMAETERDVLLSLREGGILENIPLFRELHVFDNFHALILTPLGLVSQYCIAMLSYT